MAENLELVRQAVDVIKNETEDGANTAARVGAAMRSILEYSEEQIEKQRTSSTALSQLVVGINNRTTELEEDRNLMQKAISANSDEVENLNEVVGDWDATGNDSVAEEIGSHYAEEGDSNYDSGLWGQTRDTRSRVSKLEAGVGSNASSEEDDGSVWGQLKWHGSEIDGLHRTVANTIKSGGKINLATISSLSLAATMSALGDNEIKMYLITDSSGNLPSTSGETAITITDTAKKLLFGRTDNFAVSVGDILAVTKLTCKVIPLNEAKAANGDFPGADGLESVWDKGQINKIAGIQTTANNALPKVDRLPSRWGDNMNNALDTGVYPWCTLGRPAGSTGAYTCIVNRTSTNDGSYDTIEQTAYGRQGELGRVFKRIIFYKSDGTDTQYGEWLEITGGSGDGVLTVSSVDELPADAENGSLAVVYDSGYIPVDTEVNKFISWEATADDFLSYQDLYSQATDILEDVELASIFSNNVDTHNIKLIHTVDDGVTINVYTSADSSAYILYGGATKLRYDDAINEFINLFANSEKITIECNPTYIDFINVLFPKFRKYIESAEIYIKDSDGWINPIETFKSELQNEVSTNVLKIKDDSGANSDATITASGDGGIILTHTDSDDLEWTATINPSNGMSMLGDVGFSDSTVGFKWIGDHLEKTTLQSGIYLEDTGVMVLNGNDGVDISTGQEYPILSAEGTDLKVKGLLTVRGLNEEAEDDPKVDINQYGISIWDAKGHENTYLAADNSWIAGKLQTSDINVLGSITTKGLQINNSDNLLINNHSLEHIFLEYQVSLIPNSGVTYNEETGYWECMNVTDITDEYLKMMLKVYNGLQVYPFVPSSIRVNIPNISRLQADYPVSICPRGLTSLKYFYYSSYHVAMSYTAATSAVEGKFVARLSPNVNYMYDEGCGFLIAICNVIDVSDFTETFELSAPNLRQVFIKGAVKNITFKSPVIHYDCLRFLVEFAANTSAIQVTVKADTYSYLMGTAEPTEEVGGTTEEWQALVTTATEKNITFATA